MLQFFQLDKLKTGISVKTLYILEQPLLNYKHNSFNLEYRVGTTGEVENTDIQKARKPQVFIFPRFRPTPHLRSKTQVLFFSFLSDVFRISYKKNAFSTHAPSQLENTGFIFSFLSDVFRISVSKKRVFDPHPISGGKHRFYFFV